jgi:hypothetical protein
MLTHWPTEFEHQAFIYEFDEETNINCQLFKYNHKRKEWDRMEREESFVDPMIGDKYEVILRSRHELIESLGKKEINLQDRFFGEKPDLLHDNESQFACVYHHGQLTRVYYDRLRISDDSKLRRDLQWVKYATEAAYKLGYWDGMATSLSKQERPKATNKKPKQIELPLGGGVDKTIKRIT